MTRSDSSSASSTAADPLGPWFRALARSLPAGVVLLGEDGAPVFANDHASEMLGLPPDAGHDAIVAELGRRLPRSNRPLRADSPHTADDLDVDLGTTVGKRRLVVRTLPIDGGETGGGRLVLIEDRTRTAALESTLALASRVQMRTVFRSHVHDLKAPLNALALNLELLRTSVDEEEDKDDRVRVKQLASVGVLQREIARLGRSLDALLRDATPGERKARGPRRLDVRRLVRDVARVVRPSAKVSEVTLRTRLADVPLHAVVDGDRVKQALLSVVLNALEAQPDGGEVRLVAQENGSCVRVLVEDDGPGIPDVLRDRVFQMNFTTKPEGTGIGLTVARSLIERQGGELRLESAPGRGTTVEILLPRDGA